MTLSAELSVDLRVLDHLGELPREPFSDPLLYQSCELVDCYVTALAGQTLRELGAEAVLETPQTAAGLATTLGVVPGFRSPLEWFLARVAEAGWLQVDGRRGAARRYQLIEPLPPSQRHELHDRAIAADSTISATLDLLDVAAAACPAIASGRVKPQGALLGLGQTALWLSYFSNDNRVYGLNNLVAALAVANRAARRPRLLEIGSGSGSATQAVLQELACRGRLGELRELHVSEPSPFFRRRTERALRSAYPELPFAFSALDMNFPFDEQGILPGSVDVIFAVNALHVAKDLQATLARARESLAPGGWVVAGECIRPFPEATVWAEMVFLLLDDFRDVELAPPHRPNAGFLTPEQWEGSMRQAGYSEVVTLPDLQTIRTLNPRFVTGAVCGQRPG